MPFPPRLLGTASVGNFRPSPFPVVRRELPASAIVLAAQTSTALDRQPKRLDHPWLGTLVGALDDRLRRRHGVSEYTHSPDCIFRVQVVTSDDDLMLPDGTWVRAGDRVIKLHLCNEQVPLSPAGPTLGWARRRSRAFEISLRELASFLSIRPEFDDATAICSHMSIAAAEQTRQVARVTQRFGLERAGAPDALSFGERIHRFGENVLVWMMVWARNPAALRSDSLRRDRTVVFLSRRTPERRYGPARWPDGGGQRASVVANARLEL
jgi:hypothetical protein